MASILELYNRIKSIDDTVIDDVSSKSIDETKETLLELNKEQLLEGRTNKGTLMPSYLTDPYFKSAESAKRYSDWKDKITPNPKRPSGTANLYINGAFHNSIAIEVKKKAIEFEASFRGSQIESKFPDIYGLNSEKRVEYNETLQPVFVKKMKNETGL